MGWLRIGYKCGKKGPATEKPAEWPLEGALHAESKRIRDYVTIVTRNSNMAVTIVTTVTSVTPLLSARSA